MSLIKLQNFSMSFGNIKILEDISFEVKTGEIISLLGPSGSGKSTILRSICGLEKNYQGEILKDIDEKEIGFIFQDFALFPHLNVEENIAFGLFKLSKKERTHRVQKVIKQFDLQEHSKKEIHQLSGGQQQRVAIARVMVLNPKIILLDEPFSNLDTFLKEKTKLWLKELIKKHNLSAILVTHDQKEALSISDKIGVLENKKLIQFDTPKELYQNPKSLYCAKFLGEVNILPKEFKNIKSNNPNSLFAIRVKDTGFSYEDNNLPLSVYDISFCGDYYEVRAKCYEQDIVFKTLKSININEKIFLDIQEKDLLKFSSN